MFLSASGAREAYGPTVAAVPETTDRVRVSYGAGLRLALDEALVIQIDVGFSFSAEETGFVDLDFGQTF